MAQIFLDNGWHGHAKGGGEILHCHRLLLFGIGQEANQATGQLLRVPWLIELNRYIFTICHLAKIRKIRGYDGHSVGTCQVCNATASRRRGVRHDGDRRILEDIW
jgi:hypothetical protein